jgi:LAO/AO transport system kinase
MATRGATGGLASATLAAADILDAGGFDVIIIETVGVGQDEVEIARASHTTVVVSAPGLGDDIQAIKAGILEIADIHVVSKCDRPDANRTIADIKNMMALSASLSEKAGVAGAGGGDELAERAGHRRAARIDRSSSRRAGLVALGVAKRRHIAEYRALKTAEDLLRSRFACRAQSRARSHRRSDLDTHARSVFRRERLLNDATL